MPVCEASWRAIANPTPRLINTGRHMYTNWQPVMPKRFARPALFGSATHSLQGMSPFRPCLYPVESPVFQLARADT